LSDAEKLKVKSGKLKVKAEVMTMLKSCVVLGLGLAVGLGAAACGGTEAESTASPVARTVPVRTATGATRDLTETLTLTGTLNPRAEVSVVSELSARLERFLGHPVLNLPSRS